MDEEMLLMDEQTKWFLEMKFTAGEDAGESTETIVKDLDFEGKAVAGLEKTHSNF